MIRRIYIVVVAALAAFALFSCGKENPENTNGLIGSWQNLKIDYVFNGDVIGTEDYSEVDNAVLTFGKDGHIESMAGIEGGDAEFPIAVPYYYSPKDKTVEITLLYFKFVLNVDKLTSSELVLSNEDMINIKLNGGTDSLGEVVDTYKGVKIYEYEDDLIYTLCYVANGKVIPCDKLSEDDIEGTFTGDINGYYDKTTAYFKRMR
ncbi:MAG: hypothetical protein UDN37_12340 [Bacteroidales bacterium]|jgi:hypothetical protein|nr:hypothetical protein [Bacteroidales bacterium]